MTRPDEVREVVAAQARGRAVGNLAAALEHAKVSHLEYLTKLEALESAGRDDEFELLRLERELRDHVTKNADNVGTKFPEEARKMHYGDIEHRAIYGEASADEARSLLEEGVEVLPLPVLPEDRN